MPDPIVYPLMTFSEAKQHIDFILKCHSTVTMISDEGMTKFVAAASLVSRMIDEAAVTSMRLRDRVRELEETILQMDEDEKDRALERQG